MIFAPEIFQPDWARLDPARLSDRLRFGTWLVESGSQLPLAHRPSLLLNNVARHSGMAVSLRTATLLQCDLGLALVGRLQAEGCPVPELASLALHEVLVNAAIHGNLDVASGPSSIWGDLAERQSQIAAALNDPVRSGRLVTVVLGWTDDHLSAAIADQGAGYRADGPVCRNTPRAAGRGLLIARAAARVDILASGCCTRLIFDCHNAVES